MYRSDKEELNLINIIESNESEFRALGLKFASEATTHQFKYAQYNEEAKIAKQRAFPPRNLLSAFFFYQKDSRYRLGSSVQYS
jgi:hypothetical protein